MNGEFYRAKEKNDVRSRRDASLKTPIDESQGRLVSSTSIGVKRGMTLESVVTILVRLERDYACSVASLRVRFFKRKQRA